MNRRSLVWVGLFGGIASVLVVWLLMGDVEGPAGSGANDARTPASALREFDARPKTPSAGVDAIVPGRLSADRLRSKMLHEPDALGPPVLARLRAAGRLGGAASTPGPFDATEQGLSAAVKARKVDLDTCFDAARLHSPGLDGALTLQVELASKDQGPSLSVASVKTDAADTSLLDGCLASVLGELTFQGTPTTLSHAVELSAER